MSYLDAPRLHFAGWFQADVSTINNNVQLYQNASFLPVYQDPANAGWNPEGTGIFRLLDCAVTGGYLDGRSLTTSADDPAIGLLLENADNRAPGKIVDLDPQQQLASQIWGMQVRLLDAARREVLSGEYAPAAFNNLWRRQQTAVPGDQTLGANYQSVLEDVDWGRFPHSRLLRDMRRASDRGRLSIEFNVFGYGRDPRIPRYTLGRIVGTIGPYRRGEPKHFVRGRQMSAAIQGSPFTPAGGVFHVQGKLADDRTSLTLDVGNAFPVVSAESGLADVGQILVGVLRDEPTAMLTSVDAAQVVTIGEVPYRDPNWYVQTAGVQTFDLRTQLDAQALLPERPLVLLTPQPDGSLRVRLQESLGGVYVRPDQLVFRIDPGDAVEMKLHATRYGAPLRTLVDMFPVPGFMGGSGGNVSPPFNPPAPIPRIGLPADAIAYPEQIQTDDNGFARVPLTASEQGPGRPRGYIAGQLYGVGYSVENQPPGYVRNLMSYVSVLALDTKPLPEAPTWYADIQPLFAQYGNLYPIMSKYVVDLNDYASVVQRLQPLRLAFSLPIADPNHMPVTRDLGRADRDIILKWLDSKGADGLPPLGAPTALRANAPALQTEAPVVLDLDPLQTAGKTAVMMQYEERQRAASADEPGEQP